MHFFSLNFTDSSFVLGFSVAQYLPLGFWRNIASSLLSGSELTCISNELDWTTPSNSQSFDLSSGQFALQWASFPQAKQFFKLRCWPDWIAGAIWDRCRWSDVFNLVLQDVPSPNGSCAGLSFSSTIASSVPLCRVPTCVFFSRPLNRQPVRASYIHLLLPSRTQICLLEEYASVFRQWAAHISDLLFGFVIILLHQGSVGFAVGIHHLGVKFELVFICFLFKLV